MQATKKDNQLEIRTSLINLAYLHFDDSSVDFPAIFASVIEDLSPQETQMIVEQFLPRLISHHLVLSRKDCCDYIVFLLRLEISLFVLLRVKDVP